MKVITDFIKQHKKSTKEKFKIDWDNELQCKCYVSFCFEDKRFYVGRAYSCKSTKEIYMSEKCAKSLVDTLNTKAIKIKGYNV